MSDTDDVMLQEAVEALRQKDKARARDLLTRLLKEDQKNAECWVWMSATVDTAKERIYCLQTALQLDPENAAAKRGLVLFGALPPDDTIEPFPIKQTRVWEEDILMAGEEPKEKGFKAFIGNPVVRLVGLLVIGAVAIGSLFFLIFSPRTANYYPTRTPGPSPTFSPTVTFLPTRTPIYRTAEPNSNATPQPLSELLDATYTPTALYVQVTHDVVSRAVYDVAMNEFLLGNWDQARQYFEQVVTLEQGSADVEYYIGETYRFQGDYQKAYDAYALAIETDAQFGPAYLGRARVQPFVNSRVDTISDLDKAVEYAPDFGEALVARAEYYIDHEQWDDALSDLESAQDVSPESAPVYYNLARVYLTQGENESALEAAQRANELDITLLDDYLVLGEAYAVNSQVEKALGVMQTYTLYVSDNPQAYAILGEAYNLNGDYKAALDAFDKSLALDKNQGRVYLQRGYANLETDHGALAEEDFRTSLGYLQNSVKDSFDAQIGIARSLYIRELYGDMYNRVETARQYAKTDAEMAQILYWRAISLEKLSRPVVALRDWKALLDLPDDAVPSDWRDYAEKRVAALQTGTPAATSTTTATSTPTP